MEMPWRIVRYLSGRVAVSEGGGHGTPALGRVGCRRDLVCPTQLLIGWGVVQTSNRLATGGEQPPPRRPVARPAGPTAPPDPPDSADATGPGLTGW